MARRGAHIRNFVVFHLDYFRHPRLVEYLSAVFSALVLACILSLILKVLRLALGKTNVRRRIWLR